MTSRIGGLGAAICAAVAMPGASFADLTYTFQTFDAPGMHQYGTVLSSINTSGVLVGSYSGGHTPMTRYTQYFTSDGTSVDTTGNYGAIGLNDSGLVVGFQLRQGALLVNGMWSTFDVLECNGVTIGRGINNAGEIVGSCSNSTSEAPGFWRSADGSQVTVIQMPVPGIRTTNPRGINDLSMIVGEYTDGTGTHGFLLDASYVTVDFPGALQTYPSGIDNLGNVVGYYVAPDARVHGFNWDGTTFTTIDVDIPDATHTYVLGNSNTGSLVGFYRNGTPTAHGFIATPN